MTTADDFHRLYFTSRVHRRTHYRGVPVVKAVTDLWAYQELIHDHGIGCAVELGSFNGGGALWLADVLTDPMTPMLRDRGCVLAVDIADRWHTRVKSDPRIHTAVDDSASAATAARILAIREVAGGWPMLVIVDSDHRAPHVLAELEMLAGVTRPGDWVVVEDTNIGGLVRPDYGPGPAEAVAEYIEQRPGDYVRDVERETKFHLTYAPGGWLRRQ